MAHFAEISPSNVVLRVVVVNNNELLDENGVESEAKGAAFCKSLFGGKWIQTSYNASTRNKFAQRGDLYSPDYDVFVRPQPFLSWTFNNETLAWEPPVPYPSETEFYLWDEINKQWVLPAEGL